MEIKTTRELGLCSGVKRAVKMLLRAANEYQLIETLGPVAHNQQLVKELAGKGVKVINELDQIQGKVLAITTHGVNPEVLSEIKHRGLRVIDTTCPIVHRAQTVARELAKSGVTVIIFGEAAHSEVEGLLGWAGNKSIAILDAKELVAASRSLRRIGVISQTTQDQPGFTEFIIQLMDISSSYLREIHVVNTLCQEIRRRREDAVRVAGKVELMLVVGGRNSANTRHLAEACSAIVETHLVEDVAEVDESWLPSKRCIGITAGASTPIEVVDEIIAKLKSF